MPRPSLLPALAIAGVLLGAAHSPACPQVLDLPPHPRLIVYGPATDPTRLQELRTLVDETGPPEGWSDRKRALVLAFRSLRAGSRYWYERNIEAEWGESPMHQDEQYRCITTLALTDLLMKSKGTLYPEYAGGRIYAQKANAFLHWWRDHGFHNWGQHPEYSSGHDALGYAEMLAAHALFYDWCHDYLSVSERAYHARAIYHLMTNEERMYLFAYGDWRYGWYDNNHLGVIFGAVGLAALALDQDDPVFNQTARDSIAWYRDRAASRVRQYLDAGFPGDGAGIEGVLYAMYGLNLALPYALATERLRTVATPYDPLPANLRVDGPRNAYQTPTWLYCEQLPFDPCGGTPLNDTAVPPYDLNAGHRAWPWLMAFSTAQHPNLALPFFHTIYPPALLAGAAVVEFDPDAPDAGNDPFDLRRVVPQPELDVGQLNSAGILLGWPEDDPPPTLDPGVLARGRYFSGRGVTYFRSGIQSLHADGHLDFRPDSCLITFECRQPPSFPPGHTQWSGHTQEDVNHFTLFFARQPLFYDSGYAGWGRYPSFFSSAHSLHEVRVGAGAWQGFAERRTQGSAIGSVIGSGAAPSFAGGINTACWSSSQVLRSVRRMVVLPRPGSPAPYLLLHDDVQLVASGKVRAQMQTGNEAGSASEPAPQIAGNIARWQKGGARAVLAFLAPAGMSLTTPVLTPNDTTNWPSHWMVRGEVPSFRTRHQIVSLIEPRFASDGSAELAGVATPIPTSDPEGLAWQIDSGRLVDVVAFRPFDRTEPWWIYPQGYPPIEAEQATLLAMRFEEAARGGRALRAGLISGGGRISCGGRRVAFLAGGRASTLTFSEAGATAWVDGDPVPEYQVDLTGPREFDSTGHRGAGASPPSAPAETEAESTATSPARTSGGTGPGDSWIDRIPNPLRPGARLDCGADGGRVTIEVYDTSGRLLRTLESANGIIEWNGRNAGGEPVPSGAYLLRCARGGITACTRRVILLR